MKYLLAWFSLSVALLAQPVASVPRDATVTGVRSISRVASAKAKKPAAPAADKAPPSSKPAAPRKKPALPRHLFM